MPILFLSKDILKFFDMELVLHSPVGSSPLKLNWPLPSSFNPDKSPNAEEVIKTIKFVCQDFPQLRDIFNDESLKRYDPESYKSIKQLCDYFNLMLAEMCISEPLQEIKHNRPRKLLEHILVQVYNQTIKEPDKLNQYEPFSPEVYGETSFELVCEMIDHMSLSNEDVFIDLGSGVGQVVLQMAALTSCKSCLGIEKADIPSQYAETLSKNFRKWMAWFGKDYGEYHIIKGDFLEERFRDVITKASLIFVNNFAFGPSVDHNLKQIFADLKDGARIVSSKAFCPLNFRITERNLSDIGTIMHVSEMQPSCESVSWTGKPVSYFVHVIDRTKLERYFQKLKQPQTTQPRRSGRPSSDPNSASTSREGSVESTTKKNGYVEKKNGFIENKKNDKKVTKKIQIKPKWSSDDSESDTPKRGVTTRRRWSEYLKKKSPNNEKTITTVIKTQNLPPKRTKTRSKGVKRKCTDLESNITTNTANTPPPPLSQESKNILILGENDEDLRPVPDTLKLLLRSFKTQYLDMMDTMPTYNFKKLLQENIRKEEERKLNLKYKAESLENHIQKLLGEGTGLIKGHMIKLGIENCLPNNLLEQAKEVVLKHKELQTQVSKLEQIVQTLENEKEELYKSRYKEAIAKSVEGDSNPDQIDKIFQAAFNLVTLSS